jgi:glycosyltransferase involved in cell wall biosynthesis
MTMPIDSQTRQHTVAIAHDYLTQRGGAERVVLSLMRAFPDAVIYTTLYEPDATYPEFKSVDIRVSWLNRIGFFRRNHRLALLLLPFATRSLKPKADVIVISTSAFAQAVTADSPKLVYCHTPPRFVYLADEYVGDGLTAKALAVILKIARPFLRALDQRAAKTASNYIANSNIVRERIKSVYEISADVVFPPHSIDISLPAEEISEVTSKFSGEDFYLVVSRLLPYKNVDKVIQAFRENQHRRLVIIGSGPLSESIRSTLPENCILLSGLTDGQMRWAYSQSKALIAASFEDFGLTVIEAAAWGKPAIALRAGGYLDTVHESVSGVFFDDSNAAEIANALTVFESRVWSPDAIKSHAEAFSESAFISEIQKRTNQLLDSYN